ncbi:uncharacterized protein LOC114334428 [Diabrotica virgifera virgifera]|uniref:Uncharacterized protein LOC114334428 n=1 Tax=Diabrotica virgifera virgifera TaxID=50390 RepID=A0A6P7FZQ3_DIAVI|nr:uncharacterized protein LOC114334428 [Diabrotica virgifera virgifera]
MALPTAIMLSGMSRAQVTSELAPLVGNMKKNLLDMESLMTDENRSAFLDFINPTPLPIPALLAREFVPKIELVETTEAAVPEEEEILSNEIMFIHEGITTDPDIPRVIPVLSPSPTDSGISDCFLDYRTLSPQPEQPATDNIDDGIEADSEKKLDVTDRILEPRLAGVDKLKRYPKPRSSPRSQKGRATLDMLLDIATEDSKIVKTNFETPTDKEMGALNYYMEVIGRLEEKFTFYRAHNEMGHIYSSLDPKIMYQKRDLLDLASNMEGTSGTWDFQPAILKTGSESFFENRSQFSRIDNLELPPHYVKRCIVENCNYNEHIYF